MAATTEPVTAVHTGRVTRTRGASAVMAIGRALLASVFIFSGVGKLMAWQIDHGLMVAEGLPYAAVLLAVAAGAEILGGLMLFTGTFTRVAAVGLCLLVGVTTFFFHDFWSATDIERPMQMVHFMKNVAIVGGLLAVAAAGTMRYSLDNRMRGRPHDDDPRGGV